MSAKAAALDGDAALIDRFLDALLAERNVSPRTLSAYRLDLEQAHAFIKKKNTALRNASEDQLSQFLMALAKTAAKATHARRLSALRQFFKFIQSEGLRQDNPTRQLTGPKLSRPLPKSLSEDDVTRLIKAASEKEDAHGARLLVMLEMLYATGMRVSELVALPVRALNTDRSSIIVRGKGNKERLIPLGEAARGALRAYLPLRTHFLKPKQESPYLFPSQRAQTGALTRQRFFQMLRELGMEVGIPPARLSPHVLRHAFATHLLDHGADLRSVQQLLGHANLATTQIYTAVATKRLTDAVNKHHPLAQKTLKKKVKA